MVPETHKDFAITAHPLNWYEVAKLLNENAQSLYDAPHGQVIFETKGSKISQKTSNRSVYLLAAFALENLIKAFLIYENPHYIEGGKLSKQLLNGHELSKLKRCKKIPAPQRSLHVFQALETGVNSWARYPCATSLERETLEETVTPELWLAYNRVFALYSNKLEKLLSKKWKGPYGDFSYCEFETKT